MKDQEKNEYTQQELWLLLRTSLADSAQGTRDEKLFLKEQLRVLEEKVHTVEDLKLQCKYEGKVAARSRTNIFAAVVASQFALFQYGTYVAYSWDIIEPLACIAGFVDAFFASIFWIRTGKPWDVSGLNKYYADKFFAKYAKKQNLDLKRYNDLRAAIENIKNRIK